MARIARAVVPGLPHHITQRGNNRQDVFLDDDDRRMYLSLLAERAATFGLRVLAYCLMPNHVHLVGVPEGDDSLAQAIGRTHLHYTQWFNRRHESTGHLWQNRFFSCPLDEAHADNALVYVEQNPVRAKLAKRAWQYRWSSAQAHVEGWGKSEVLDLDWWRKRWTPTDWKDLLSADTDDEQTRAIRSCTERGRPLGSDQFVSGLEARLGRVLRAAPVGRPKRR